MLTTAEAAALLRLNPKTLAIWRQQQRGPRYAQLGRAIRYRASDVRAWVAMSLVDPCDPRRPRS